MTIPVRQEHIDQGIPRNAHKCFIAQAIKSWVPGACYPYVDTQRVSFSDRTTRQRYTYLTTRESQKNLLKFDRGERVLPFPLKLGLPIKVEPMTPYTPVQRGEKRDRPQAKPCRSMAGSYSDRAFGLRKFEAA